MNRFLVNELTVNPHDEGGTAQFNVRLANQDIQIEDSKYKGVNGFDGHVKLALDRLNSDDSFDPDYSHEMFVAFECSSDVSYARLIQCMDVVRNHKNKGTIRLSKVVQFVDDFFPVEPESKWNHMTVAEFAKDSKFKLYEELEEFEIEEVDVSEMEVVETPTQSQQYETVEMIPQEVTEVVVSSDLSEEDRRALAEQVKLRFSEQKPPRNDLMVNPPPRPPNSSRSWPSCRDKDARPYLAKKLGGTDKSEAAVDSALAWLAAHQSPDGSWNCDHRHGACRHRCADHGSNADARAGATALALLALLGAGHSHKEGTYKQTVARGLYYIASRMSANGKLNEKDGKLYSQGVSALAMCEAYAMSHDRTLLIPSQKLVNYSIYAQDPVGGGWGYDERSRGTTSTFAWHLLAQKNGHRAYLQIPPSSIVLSTKYLNSVESGDGAYFGYSTSSKTRTKAMTAIGLLCRVQMGMSWDAPALKRGVAWLTANGPSKDDIYANFFTTQLVFHYGGDTWKRWNPKMRDHLVRTQATQGHAKGSWFFQDRGSSAGGRLYCTALAAMILEVYYRDVPRFKPQEGKFPL